MITFKIRYKIIFEELLNYLKVSENYINDIKCMEISYSSFNECDDLFTKDLLLYVVYTKIELDNLISKLVFYYNNFEMQELYGCIWYKDNTLSERK